MTDISLIEVLKRHGWKTHKTSTLKTWTKERLVEEIQALENNWACALEKSENQYILLLKMQKEIEQLQKELRDTILYNKKHIAGLVADKDFIKAEYIRLKLENEKLKEK